MQLLLVSLLSWQNVVIENFAADILEKALGIEIPVVANPDVDMVH